MTEIEYKERLREIKDSCHIYEDCRDGSYEACIDSKVYKLDKQLRIQSEALEEYDEALQVLAEDDVPRRNNGMPKV